jgi:ABC-type antimicrobial peptide transport system ATPase subunit
VALLDEPLAGVDGKKSQWIADRLRRLADEGHALLLVDHDVASILRICDTVYVMDFGDVIASGQPDVIRTNPRRAGVSRRRSAGGRFGVSASVLEIRNLDAGYGGVPVVRNFELTMEEARSSPSSARTARANPPCSSASSACCRSSAATSTSSGGRFARSARAAPRVPAWHSSRPTARFSRR